MFQVVKWPNPAMQPKNPKLKNCISAYAPNCLNLLVKGPVRGLQAPNLRCGFVILCAFCPHGKNDQNNHFCAFCHSIALKSNTDKGFGRCPFWAKTQKVMNIFILYISPQSLC